MKFSIITVTYNDLENLKKTLKSVLGQSFRDFEYVIVDGNSSDGTKEYLKTLNDKRIKWISEKDSGLYDAMNKGSNIASGDFAIFLNAGDEFFSEDVLSKVFQKIKKEKIYFGRAKIISNEGISWFYPGFDVKNYKNWVKFSLPNHQSIFFPKSCYKNIKYDTRLKIGADDDYKLQAFKKFDYEFLDEVIVTFKRDGVSANHKSFKLYIQRVKESFIRNKKHKRYIRLFIDPFKISLMFFINRFLGDKAFLRFVKIIVGIKNKGLG
jgi:putative colanic acid biosynthesis glycosyltransferase